MTAPLRPATAGGAPPNDRARLKEAAHQLEAVFLNQLFQAMRQSVPDGGLLSHSAGEDMMTSMMDEMVAQRSAGRLSSHLADAIYRQLSRQLPPEQAASGR